MNSCTIYTFDIFRFFISSICIFIKVKRSGSLKRGLDFIVSSML